MDSPRSARLTVRNSEVDSNSFYGNNFDYFTEDNNFNYMKMNEKIIPF